jgi:tetratricopeptide (TPR) repeat protein
VRAGPLHREIDMRRALLLPVLPACVIWAQCPDEPARFQELERSGQQAFVRRDFARAAEYLRQAVCYAPSNAHAWHELALAQAASGDFPGADLSLDTAEGLAPPDAGVLLSHAQVQLSLDQPDRARATLQRALQLPAAPRPMLGRLYALLARAYIERKQAEAALAAFLRAQQAAPLDVETLLLLATIENSQGAYADAVRNARAVLDAGSAATQAQKGAAAAIAGLAYKNQKLFDDAIRLLEQANRVAPVPGSCLALAEIYETGGKLPDAVKSLQQAHAAIPDSAAIAIALGRNLVSAGDALQAAGILTQVTRQFPGEQEAWRWLAEARIALGQGAAAIAALQELARRAPGYPMVDVMLAQAYLKQEPVDYEAALRILEHAEKISPSDPDIYYLRGKIYAEQGRLQDAIAPLLHAIDLAPQAATSYYQLGLVYRKLNRPTDAAQQFERFSFFKAESR